MSDPSRPNPMRPIMGWREWISLPHLGVEQIKAKIDTGARSSALHAFEIEAFEQQGQTLLRFKIHPEQKNDAFVIEAEAELLDRREIRNSGGKAELRFVIQTEVTLNHQTWPIELTLTNRDNMGFRMLLGREAVRGRFLVDPGQSFLQSAALHSTLEQQRT
ncbi:MAG: ATP-dependent zinc protease [Thermosynechococcaceae cyanobacterium]